MCSEIWPKAAHNILQSRAWPGLEVTCKSMPERGQSRSLEGLERGTGGGRKRMSAKNRGPT
eukprot:1215943-Pyramimonas_sp.AAC.1